MALAAGAKDVLPLILLGNSRLFGGARSGTRTRTCSRIADFESAAAAITPPWLVASEGERAMGIEPTSSAWKADALPLSYARDGQNKVKYIIFSVACVETAGAGGFTIPDKTDTLRETGMNPG